MGVRLGAKVLELVVWKIIVAMEARPIVE